MAQKIQFLRNKDISASKAAALQALEDKLKLSTNNGEPIINMYYDGEGDAKTVKTLFGIVTKDGGYSIFAPSDEASSDVDAKILAAINALDKDDTAVADSYVSSVKEANGIIEVSRVALPVKSVTSADKTVTATNTNGAVDVKVNIDGESIVVDENTGALSVAKSALIPYVGADAIKVSDVVDSKKTISLGINLEDKVLSQSENGLLATLSMSYDSTAKEIKLLGKDSAEISTIDASDFVKDGMLSNVDYSKGDADHAEADGPYLVFTWNTDSDVSTPMWVSLKGLVDVYTGTTDEIVVTNNVISLAAAIKNAIAAALNEISVSTTDVDAKGYIKAKVSTKADKKQSIGVGVTYGSFKTDSAVQVDGIATVEAVNDVIVANEKVTSEALNKLNADIQSEVTRAENAESDLSAKITTNTTNISDEVTRAKAAEKTNTDAISAEVTRATNKENEISDSVATLTSNYLKSITAADKSVTVSETKDNAASVKVNVDSESIVLDENKGYLAVSVIDGGEY
jgi:hypothetical protein